jgi:hypothetical protein
LRIARQHFKLAMTGQQQHQQQTHNRSQSTSSSFMNSPFTQPQTPTKAHPHQSFQNAYPSSIFPQPQNFQPPPPLYQPPAQPLPLDLQSQVSTIRANENLERQSGEYTECFSTAILRK